MANVYTLHMSPACILLLCAPLSSFHLIIGGSVISSFFLIFHIFLKWMTGEVNLSSSLGVLIFFSSFSSCRFGFPSLRLSICFWFTVYSNTAGCSEPLGMKSRLVSDGQLSASSSFRTWGIDTFTWHPQFARLDKQGKTNAWSPAHNNRTEWIQVRETSAVTCPLRPADVAEYNCFLCSLTRSI